MSVRNWLESRVRVAEAAGAGSFLVSTAHGRELLETLDSSLGASIAGAAAERVGAHVGGATSALGASDVLPRRTSQKARILTALESGARLNADEAKSVAGFPPEAAIHVRLSEMARHGWVEKCGERDGLAGSAQTLYRITPFGRDVLGRILRGAH